MFPRRKNKAYRIKIVTTITLYFWAFRDYLVQLPSFANVKMDPSKKKILLLFIQVMSGLVRNGTQASFTVAPDLANL